MRLTFASIRRLAAKGINVLALGPEGATNTDSIFAILCEGMGEKEATAFAEKATYADCVEVIRSAVNAQSQSAQEGDGEKK